MTIRHWVLSLLAVICGWFAVLLGVMYFTDAAPGAVALFPPKDLTSKLPADFAVVGAGPQWIAVRSDAADLGPSLYQAGAWIVLPAGLPGCLPLGEKG